MAEVDRQVLHSFVQQNVQKFAELKPLVVGPPDRMIERFQRERYSLVGRPDERPEGDQGVAIDPGFNIGYIRCEPGKGHCMHSHPAVEIFIPMSGLWEIEVGGVGTITAGPWDVVSMPGGTFHAATNIGDEVGYMMSVNNGTKTAPYTIAPEIIAEIGEAGRAGKTAA